MEDTRCGTKFSATGQPTAWKIMQRAERVSLPDGLALTMILYYRSNDRHRLLSYSGNRPEHRRYVQGTWNDPDTDGGQNRGDTRCRVRVMTLSEKRMDWAQAPLRLSAPAIRR